MRSPSQLSSESPALDGPAITLPAASVNPCQVLTDYLQHRWNQEVGESSLRLRCAPRQEQLLVLVEHVITEQPPVEETFGRIKALLEEAPESLWSGWLGAEDLPEQLTVNLFLRVAAQKRPYLEQQYDLNLLSGVAPDMFSLYCASTSTAPTVEAAGEVTPDSSVSTLALGSEDAASIALDPDIAAAFWPASDPLEFEPLDSDSLDPAAALGGDREAAEAASGSAAAGLEDGRSATDAALPEREEPLPREPLHIPRSVWAVGLGLCLATFAGGFYLASRPCFSRSCPPLTLAQQQAQDATELLQIANSWQDIERSREQLQGAISQLRNVPAWSSHNAEARGLRQRYRQLLEATTPVQDALRQASEAEKKTQLGTIQERQWQDVQAHWEAAISQLRSISPESPLYALAQDKLQQYQHNLEATQASLLREREGQRLLAQARNYAARPMAAVAASGNAASQGDQNADNLAVLQQTEARLADAIFTLKKIPQGTTAYQEAMRLTARYQSELSINQGQQSQEASIVDSYRQALAYAEDAKRSEASNQWKDAREFWQTALSRIEQIPSQSPYFNKAQSLVPEYTYALQAAERQANQQEALAQVKAELDVICAGSPQVCTYEVTPSRIAVQLTLDYERAVLTAGAVGDEYSRMGALQHVQELEKSLESASNRARIPLELFDPDGVLVGSHHPRERLGTI